MTVSYAAIEMEFYGIVNKRSALLNTATTGYQWYSYVTRWETVEMEQIHQS